MNPKTLRQTGYLLLIAGACLVGCKPTPIPPPAGQTDPFPARNYPQITVAEKLDDFVGFGPANIDEGPPMTVAVPIRVLVDQGDLSVQYRFLFFDSAGRILNPNRDWRYMELPALTRMFMEGTSLGNDAEDWSLEVRPAR